MKAYKIVDWVVNYEVNTGGRLALKGQKLKINKLKFIRCRVFGHAKSPEFQEIMEIGNKKGVAMGLAAFGLFMKLLELAANQKRDFRGWILDTKQRPVDIEKIAKLLGERDVSIVKIGLDILMDPAVDFVEYAEFGGNTRDSAGFSENSENSECYGGLFLNNNLTEQTELKTAEKKESAFDKGIRLLGRIKK